MLLRGDKQIVKKIIWIDGVLGIGKTTTAYAVLNKTHKSVVLDADEFFPKILAKVISGMPVGGCYPQNNITFLKEFRNVIMESIEKNDTVIVPMSITMKETKNEFFDKICNANIENDHFILFAKENERLVRIENDGSERDKELSIKTFKEYNDFLRNNFADATWVDTTEMSAEEVADFIVKVINGNN